MLLPTLLALRAPVVVGVPLNEPCVVGEGWLRVGAGVALELGVEVEVVELVELVELDTEELDVPRSIPWGAANATASTAKREIHWSGNMVNRYCMA